MYAVPLGREGGREGGIITTCKHVRATAGVAPPPLHPGIRQATIPVLGVMLDHHQTLFDHISKAVLKAS